MNETFVVVDLEATSREPTEAHIVEWAAVVIQPPWFGQEKPATVHTGLVRPPIPIPPETSAVHHIIDADVSYAPHWLDEGAKLFDLLAPDGVIAVAHNADYERTILARELPPLPALRWLCSYKAALRVWPDAPGHSNETLRYFLKLQHGPYTLGRGARQMPHSAAHDAIVTALLLAELQRAGTSIEDMLAWTEQPAMLPTCPLGDWRGHKWADVDEGFLLWIMRKIHDREDVRFCAQAELDRREKERRAARPLPAGVEAVDEA